MCFAYLNFATKFQTPLFVLFPVLTRNPHPWLRRQPSSKEGPGVSSL